MRYFNKSIPRILERLALGLVVLSVVQLVEGDQVMGKIGYYVVLTVACACARAVSLKWGLSRWTAVFAAFAVAGIFFVLSGGDRPAPPAGIEYVPVLGWLRWGWSGRFIQQPSAPGTIGIDISVSREWHSREAQYVVLEAPDQRLLTNCVVGYWIPGQQWRFRVNRPIGEVRRIALKLRFPVQNFAVYTSAGELVTLQVAGYYHNRAGRQAFLDAPEL